jgi:hypothetical protein
MPKAQSEMKEEGQFFHGGGGWGLGGIREGLRWFTVGFANEHADLIAYMIERSYGGGEYGRRTSSARHS